MHVFYDNWPYYFFDSYDEVKRAYDNTRPVISCLHTEENDVRPLFKRDRKHYRFVKINDNKIGLDLYGQSFFYQCHKESKLNLDEETLELFCHVVWERLPDGRDKLTVRNGLGNGYFVSVYSLLNHVLPRRMDFRMDRNGNHWLSYKGEKYPLPKNRYATRFMAENTRSYINEFGKTEWGQEKQMYHSVAANKEVAKGKPLALIFGDESVNYKQEFIRNSDGEFEHVGKKYKLNGRRVNKEKKNGLFDKNKLKEFVDYAYLTNAMFDNINKETAGKAYEQLLELHVIIAPTPGPVFWKPSYFVSFIAQGNDSKYPELAQSLLNIKNLINNFGKTENEAEFHLAILLLKAAGVNHLKERKDVSTGLHSAINTMFDLYTKKHYVEEE